MNTRSVNTAAVRLSLLAAMLLLAASCSSSPAAERETDRPAGPTTASVAPGLPTTEGSNASSTAESVELEPVDYFATISPGEELRTGADCAELVRPAPENVPENTPYVTTVGVSVDGETYLSRQLEAGHLEQRIDGDFTGSTDEVIQWAACKWGFDEDLVRAQVYTESRWFAGWLGDCGVEAQPEAGGSDGCASTGLLQIRAAEVPPRFHPGTWPHAWQSAAFNLDYSLAVLRACYEGLEPWLVDFTPNGDAYGPGDHLGCMGRWFSGEWRDDGALNYLQIVDENLTERPWESPFVGCPDWEDTFYCSGLET